MNTPRKNYENLASPYAKSLSQYPSQSEDYLPFELGGPGTGNNHGNRQTPQKHARYTSTPAKFDPYRGGRGGGGGGGGRGGGRDSGGNYQQNRYQNNFQQQQHRGRGYNNRFYGISGGGRQSFNREGGDADSTTADGEKNYQRQPYRQSRGGRGGGNGGGGGQHRFQNNKNNEGGGASYFHPSMLEDPWRDLMERHNAIRSSQINIEEPQQEQQQPDDAENMEKNDSNAEESAASDTEPDNEKL